MKNLTSGSSYKNIFYFAMPMLYGNIFQQLYNVVDSIVVGKFIGKSALAAVGASFPIIFLMIALLTGTTMGSGVLVSQFFGAKDEKRLKSMIDTTYLFLLFFSIGITILGVVFGGDILKLMNTPDDILSDAKLYLDIQFLGIFTMIGYNGISAVLRGVGNSKLPLYLLIVSTFVNIGLDLLLVLVFEWGLAGVSIATVIAQAVSFLVGAYIINYRYPLLAIRFRNLSIDWPLFFKSLKIGIPSGIQQMAVATGFMALLRIVNGFGTNAVAAFTAAGRIDSFAMMPSMNFSMAVATFVGQNIGAGKMERVKDGLWATILLSVVISTIMTVIILIWGEELLGLFSTDQAVIKIGVEYLYIVSSFYIFFAVMFAVNGALRGAGDTFVPMIVTILSLWLFRVPISAFLSQYMGTAGIWWGIPIAWILGAVLTTIYYKTGRWKNKKRFK